MQNKFFEIVFIGHE